MKITVKSVLLTAVILLTGCTPPDYLDGDYQAQSSRDEDGNYGVVKLSIKDNRFISCSYESFNSDGTLKDENYGKKHHGKVNKGYYRNAQFAISTVDVYARKLLEVQDIDDVDNISGATIIHDQFEECVEKILDEA
ncbi:MAG: hypothetical protein ACI4M9_05945 [Succinivibrio sp.]